MLRYETVNSHLLEVLQKCMMTPALKDFRLVGGTSLSLQRGHRMSVDIDLFTDMPYGEMPLDDIRAFLKAEFQAVDGLDQFRTQGFGYKLHVMQDDMPVKMDLFYVDKFIFPVNTVDGIRLADQRDIAAMKMLPISDRGNRPKDYWDIHELLKDYELADIMRWAIDRYPYNLNIDDMVAGLSRVDVITPDEEEIISLTDVSWSLVQDGIMGELMAEQHKLQFIQTFCDRKADFLDNLEKWAMSGRELLPSAITSEFEGLLADLQQLHTAPLKRDFTDSFFHDEILYPMQSRCSEAAYDRLSATLGHELDMQQRTHGWGR